MHDRWIKEGRKVLWESRNEIRKGKEGEREGRMGGRREGRREEGMDGCTNGGKMDTLPCMDKQQTSWSAHLTGKRMPALLTRTSTPSNFPVKYVLN